MRVWLNKWVLGKYVKILEMEDDKVIYENELGKKIRMKKNIRSASQLWEMYGKGFNPYLFADMSRDDCEEYVKKNGKSKLNRVDSNFWGEKLNNKCI